MASRVRKSVPLSDSGMRGLLALRMDPMWREAAMELEGIDLSDNPSEAEALQVMVEIGRRVIEERASEKALEQGYAALAASLSDEDRELDHALSRRALSRTPDE